MYNMFYKSDEEFTDKPSYSSDEFPTNIDRWGARVELDRVVDDWVQSDLVEQFGSLD